MRCWYTRWQMSNALDRGERGGLSARMSRGHAARCAECQAFGASLESLHGRLSRGAHAAAVPVVAARHARWPLLVGGPLAVGAAAAIALAIGVADEPMQPTVAPPSPVAEVPTGEPPPDRAPVVGVEQVALLVTRATARTPLEAELDNLLRDGRRGIAAILATSGLRGSP
jgi:hypothetical protein